MSLTRQETAQLRQELTERYPVELQGRITRVEFLSKEGRIIVYFRANDSFEKPKPPPEEPKEYILLAYEKSLEDEPKRQESRELAAIEGIFRMYMRAGYKHLILYENGEKKTEYIAK
ncbi:MAG: hypothetical protein IKB62_04160 [Oscillospiraceae bacterium]|nr:hypothetical protein [Oscillospiraceae bacterium]